MWLRGCRRGVGRTCEWREFSGLVEMGMASTAFDVLIDVTSEIGSMGLP